MRVNVFTIPPGAPFAESLARELSRRAEGKAEALARMRVLLPTRRACRALRETFLDLTNGKPLLLPRLQPLGDVEEEELEFGAEAIANDLPAAIDPLNRQMQLARLVMAMPEYADRREQALSLAAALARLLDRVHTEGLDLAMLPQLAGDEFAAHWQVTLNFLAIIAAQWPAYLADNGLVDGADRRNRLLRAQAAAWDARPPTTPVIAAGITGSIPAAAELLRVIAGLSQGSVILPGLDCGMSDESWNAVDDTHPQAPLKKLLARVGIDRADVKLWPNVSTGNEPREWLIREAMRPASVAGHWTDLHDDVEAKERIPSALAAVTRVDAATPQEEADVIALYLREALETPGRTAALVTPDRILARRVAAVCRRWGLSIDDSAGRPLHATPPMVFLQLVAETCGEEMRPAALLPLLRHDFCRLGFPVAQRREALAALEIAALRGPRPAPGIAGLLERLKPEDVAARDLLERLQKALAPLLYVREEKYFAMVLAAHLAAAEALAATPDEPGAAILWSHEAGEAAAEFFAGLHAQAGNMPSGQFADYWPSLAQLMQGITVRPRWGTHPRLAILGRMEARLLQSDLVILGGLNEESWPGAAAHDPWMSRPMMAAFGMPSPEAAIGLAAHDFTQMFGAHEVILTRAARAGNAPSVPSRWLQRLDTVLRAAGYEPSILTQAGETQLARARTMDWSAKTVGMPRPAPRPPLAARPRRISVTKVDDWLRDPYQIYARYCLRLKPLDAVEKTPGDAERGNVLHSVLAEYYEEARSAPVADVRALLLELGARQLATRTDQVGLWDFWWPRFERIADWFAEHEKAWLQTAMPLASERTGGLKFDAPNGPFTLTARVDRIDRLKDGTAAIVDYKSGGAYSKKALQTGHMPQLPLEALILSAGGFEELPALVPSYLGYWKITGAEKPAEEYAVEGDLQDLMALSRQRFAALIARYDDPATAYFSIPDPDHAPRFNDYEHLARVKEWAALNESTEEAA